jgi:hypothetical protein
VLGGIPLIPSHSFSIAKVESRIGGTGDDEYRGLSSAASFLQVAK